MILIIDPVTGMAGDMLIAALLDAGAPVGPVEEIMNYAGNLLGRAEIKVEKKQGRKGTGTRLSTTYLLDHHYLPAQELGGLLEKILAKFLLGPWEKDFARRAFQYLCEAEAHAHSSPQPGDIHLHEAQDILVDISGSALAIQLLRINPEGIICRSPVFCGGGSVTFSHGTFAVPAPATRALISARKIPVQAGPFSRELLTPTGAALLAALAPNFKPREEHQLKRKENAVKGVGLGTLVPPEGINLVNGLVVYLLEE